MTKLPANAEDTHTSGKDLLVRNSFFLMGSTLATSGLGFLFWVVAARFFSAADVGVASSLMSALNLLSYLSLVGLNGTIIRYLGTGELRSLQLTQSLLGVTLSGTILGVGYVLIAPSLVAELSPLHGWFGALFVLSSALAAVNLLTDSAFIGLRAAVYNVAIDGLLQSLSKIAALFALLAFGMYGVFGANTVALAIATAASLYALWRSFGVRFRLGHEPAFDRSQARYSLGTYVSSALNIAPALVVPLIIMHGRGPASSAFYFTAFQVASLLYAVPFGINESNFSEASRFPERRRETSRRALRLSLSIVIPAAFALGVLGPWVLHLFGADYASEGAALLRVFALAAIPTVFYSWSSFLLKINGQVVAMVVNNVVYLGVILGLNLLWTNEDLVWVGWAWVLGNLAATPVALIADRRHNSRETAAHTR